MDDSRTQDNSAQPRLIISESQIQEYLGVFPSLDREAIVGALIAAGPSRTDVEGWLHRMAERRQPAQASLSERKLYATMHFIESSLHRRLTVAEIAQAACLSEFHFSRAFTKTVGRSPHAYITVRRIERAKQLLSGTELPIAAIASQVGFRTQSHFTGVFAKLVGLTPRRYREGARQA